MCECTCLCVLQQLRRRSVWLWMGIGSSNGKLHMLWCGKLHMMWCIGATRCRSWRAFGSHGMWDQRSHPEGICKMPRPVGCAHRCDLRSPLRELPLPQWAGLEGVLGRW